MIRRELGLAVCGLACCLCSENQDCPGCQANGCKQAPWCENLACAREKGVSHCFSCPAPCQKGMLQKVKPAGFTLFARRHGEQALLDRLDRLEAQGMVYHREGVIGDYDRFDTPEALAAFLEDGENPSGRA